MPGISTYKIAKKIEKRLEKKGLLGKRIRHSTILYILPEMTRAFADQILEDGIFWNSSLGRFKVSYRKLAPWIKDKTGVGYMRYIHFRPSSELKRKLNK